MRNWVVPGKATGRVEIKQRIITAFIALPVLFLCVVYASQGLFAGLHKAHVPAREVFAQRASQAVQQRLVIVDK